MVSIKKAWILNFFLCMQCLMACARPTGEKGKCIFEKKGDLFLVDASGNIRLLLNAPQNSSKPGGGHDIYSQPWLSLTNDRAVFVCDTNCIRNSDGPKITSTTKFQIVKYEIMERRLSVIYEVSDYTEGQLVSPIFSCDNRRIFFLKGNKLMAYDGISTKVISEIPNRIEISTGSYIRPHQGFIYVILIDEEIRDGGSYEKNNVWQVDVETGVRKFVGYVLFGYGMKILENSVPEDTFNICFGALGHPVMKPIPAAHDEGYFVDETQEGFMAKRYIGYFDRKTSHFFNIHTIWWHFYSE